MTRRLTEGGAPMDRWVSPAGARYDRSTFAGHPTVQATWVTRGGADRSASAFTAARTHTSVTVKLTTAGHCHTGVRLAGELTPAEPTSGTLVGVELHPWLGPRAAERTATALDVDRLAELLGRGDVRRAVQLLIDAASATGLRSDPAAVEEVRSLLSGPATRRTRDHARSERTARRLVTGATGLTPMRLRRTARAGVARNVIATTDLELAEVAVVAGFSDQSHMTHEFNALCGYTPGQWRQHTAAWVRTPHGGSPVAPPGARP